MMPAFKHLSQEDKDAIAAFVLNQQKEQLKKYTGKLSALDSFRKLPYQISVATINFKASQDCRRWHHHGAH